MDTQKVEHTANCPTRHVTPSQWLNNQEMGKASQWALKSGLSSS